MDDVKRNLAGDHEHRSGSDTELQLLELSPPICPEIRKPEIVWELGPSAFPARSGLSIERKNPAGIDMSETVEMKRLVQLFQQQLQQGQQQTEILQRIELSLRKEELAEKQAAQENQENRTRLLAVVSSFREKHTKTKAGR